MVWFYPGAFVLGNTKVDKYSPDFLLTEDIVLVTVNYRLGILGKWEFIDFDLFNLYSFNVPGFIDFQDPSVPGTRNLGIKDQRLALEWIQRNIKNFGGDPKNVTIFGESAGGTSCHYHMLSHNSKGLFQKAIMQSGSTLSVFGQGDPNILKIVKAMGHNVSAERQAYDILVSATIEDIINVQQKFGKVRIKLIQLNFILK